MEEGEEKKEKEAQEEGMGKDIPVFDNIVIKLPNSPLCDFLEYVRKNQMQDDSPHGDSKDDKRRRYRVLDSMVTVNCWTQ